MVVRLVRAVKPARFCCVARARPRADHVGLVMLATLPVTASTIRLPPPSLSGYAATRPCASGCPQSMGVPGTGLLAGSAPTRLSSDINQSDALGIDAHPFDGRRIEGDARVVTDGKPPRRRKCAAERRGHTERLALVRGRRRGNVDDADQPELSRVLRGEGALGA